MEDHFTKVREQMKVVVLKMNTALVMILKYTTYFLLIFSVVTKLLCVPYIHQKFEILKIVEYCQVFGSIEFFAICFFLYSKTMGFGLALLCSYFGGAIAIDFRSPEYLYQPIVLIILIFITALFRKPSIFYEGLTLNDNGKMKVLTL
jgi:hypothetical protein